MTRFELDQQGTKFLDEIGDIAYSHQVKMIAIDLYYG